MGKIDRFEDLECWIKTRKLMNLIYSFTKKAGLNNDFGMKDQMRRASVSAMSNIAEGFAHFSKNEFIRYLGYSISSLAELKSHLYVSLDINYIKKEDFNNAYKMVTDCENLCKGLMKYLKGNSRSSTIT